MFVTDAKFMFTSKKIYEHGVSTQKPVAFGVNAYTRKPDATNNGNSSTLGTASNVSAHLI